jgi:hypothetical protein
MSEFSPTRIMIDAETFLSALEHPGLLDLYDELIFSPNIEPCLTQRGLIEICNHFLSNNSISGEGYCNFLREIKSIFTICEFDESWLPDLKPLTAGITDLKIALDILTAHKFNAAAIVTHQPAKFNEGRNMPIISIDSLRVSYRFRQTLIELRKLLFQCSCIELAIPILKPRLQNVAPLPRTVRQKQKAAKPSKTRIGSDFSRPSKSHVSQWWTIASSRSDCMRRMSGPRSLEGTGHLPTKVVNHSLLALPLETAYEPGRSMRDYWRNFN